MTDRTHTGVLKRCHDIDFEVLCGYAGSELLIGGDWRTASDGATFDVTDPATGSTIASVSNATTDDAVAAADAATAAGPEMAAMSPRMRAMLLQSAFETVNDHRDILVQLMSLEMGRSLSESQGELNYGAEFLRWFAGEAERLQGDSRISPDGTNRVMVTAQPVGPSILVTPWNFPLAMLTRKLAPAWAAGCTAIAKPAPETPLTALYFARLMDELDAPDGAFNVVTTTRAPEVVATLIDHPGTRKISFTGSTAVGRLLAAHAGTNLMRCSLELGGNAPLLVFEDADLDRAVEGAYLAKMRNMGEACTAANRFVVHESIAERFTDAFRERIRDLQLGHGHAEATDLGPLITPAAVARVGQLVDEALAAGASVALEGGPVEGDGNFFAPMILADVTPDARILHEEIFAPVVTITTFVDDDEAIRIANDTDYGLVAYVFTSDIDRGLSVAERLDAGMVGLNRGLVSNVAAPFGGIKDSGIGREGGREGIWEYLDRKYIAIDRVG